ncbi:MAG: hypothetical protein ABEK59_11440 [Halobacteria archaeon]
MTAELEEKRPTEEAIRSELETVEDPSKAKKLRKALSGIEGKREELNRIKERIAEVSQSQQIVLPSIRFQEQEPGRYQAQVSSIYSEDQPTVGVLMGADLLQNLPMIFGSHKDEAIIQQYEFIEALEEAQPILQKIRDKPRSVLSEYEVSVVENLQNVARATSQTLTNQMTNEKMRQAAGEHEKFTGAVGYAINSFALAPHEAVLGERFSRLAQDLRMEEVIKNQVNRTVLARGQSNRYEQEFRRLQEVLNVVEPDTSRSQTLAKETVETALRSQAQAKKTDVLMAHIYQKLLGEQEEGDSQEVAQYLQDLQADGEELKRHNRFLNLLAGGVIRRSGAPAGTFAGLGTQEGAGEELGSKILSMGQYSERSRQEGGGLRPDPQRSQTGMIVPALGSLVAGLGDFDGDSYQLLLAQAGKLQEKVVQRQQELKAKQDEISELRRIEDEKDSINYQIYKAKQDQVNLKLEEFSRKSKLKPDKLTEQENRQYQRLLDFDREKEGEVDDLLPAKTQEYIDQRKQELETLNQQARHYKDINTLKKEKEELEDLYSQEVTNLSDKRLKLENAQTKQMEDLKRWVKNFTSLPEFTFEGLSTPESLTYVSQKFDMSGVEDASSHLETAERKITLFGTALEQEARSKGLDPEDYKMQFVQQARDREQAEAERLVKERLSFDQLKELYGKDQPQARATEELRQALTLAQERSEEGLTSMLSHYYAKQGSFKQTFEGIQGSLKKAEGAILNPYEFETVQTVVGEGGSKLIGSAYNTLIPLLERSMFEQSVTQVAQSAKEAKEIFSPETLEQLQTNQEQIQQRYYGTLSTLTGFQQLVRDALKAKEGSELHEALKNVEKGQPYQQALSRLEELREHKKQGQLPEGIGDIDEALRLQEMEVQEHLRTALSKTTGAVINFGETEFGAQAEQRTATDDLLASKFQYDQGLTAFGSLIEFAEFTKTKDDREVYQRFVQGRGLEDEFSRQSETAERFIAGKMVGLLERTEAAYKATTLPEAGVDLAISKAEEWKNKQAYGELEGTYKRHYELIQAYQDVKSDPDKQQHSTDQLKQMLLGELMYETIRKRNRETNAIDADTVLNLRQMQFAEQKLAANERAEEYETRFARAGGYPLNVINREMARGHTVEIQEALQVTSAKAQAVESVLTDLGYTSEDIDNLPEDEKMNIYQRLARVTPNDSFNGILSDDQVKEINKAFAGASGKERGQRFRQATAGLSTWSALSEQAQNPQRDEASVEYLNEMIKSVTSEEGVDTEAVNQLYQQQQTAEQQQQLMQELMNFEGQQQAFQNRDIQEEFRQQQTEQTSSSPFVMERGALEGDLFGAFSSASLFALAAGGDMPQDQRLGMFAFDTLQGLSEAAAAQNRQNWTKSLMSGEMTNKAQNQFQLARIKQSIQSEGMIQGTMQGVAQELAFRGISQASDALVQRAMPVKGRAKGTRAIAGVASEVMSSVFAQSTARAITGTKTAQGQRTQEFMGRFLGQYVQQVWQMVEQAQERMLNSSVEVLDTSENQAIAFDDTGYISELEWDIETGLVTLAEDGTPLNEVFDDSEQQQLASTVDAQTPDDQQEGNFVSLA